MLNLYGPAVMFEKNAAFSNSSVVNVEDAYQQRKVNMRLTPGYGTAANFVVASIKKISRLGP